MPIKNKKELTPKDQDALISISKTRFQKNNKRHKGLEWSAIEARLRSMPEKLWSLDQMEKTGGEPDVVGLDKQTGEYLFYDCSAESPKDRRSLCYDREALDSRKENKPSNSALDLAAAMNIEMLTEEQYRYLQQLGPVDTKTSSWIQTPADIRALGGALFADYRYGKVFVYHNGASSYYAARGFRACLKV